MANGYPTGVSSTPLDIASAGQIFARSAIESRLAEIEANRIEVEDNVKTALKAMSVSTIEGLSQNMRVRYQKEIESYRDKVREKMINGRGKLSLDDEREIQDGFVDLQKRQANDVFTLKQIAQAQNMIVKDFSSYDPRAVDELKEAEDALDKGEYVGDPMAIVLKNRIPLGVGDIASKFYGEEITSLGKTVTADFRGNIFKQTELVGLDPQMQQLTNKAVRLRDRMLEDPRIKMRYTGVDGSVDPDAFARERQAVEDSITQIIESTKPYRQSTGGAGGSAANQVFAAPEQGVERVQFGVGEKGTPVEEDVEYQGIISLTNVPTFTYGSDKVLAESVVYYPVAKDRKTYEKGLKRSDKVSKRVSPHKNMIIPKSRLESFDRSDYELKPFVKLYASKSNKLPFGATKEQFFQFLQPGDWDVRYEPLEENTSLKAAISGRMGSRGNTFVNKLETMSSGMNASQGVKKLTDAQESQVSKLLEQNPGWTREEIINELGL